MKNSPFKYYCSKFRYSHTLWRYCKKANNALKMHSNYSAESLYSIYITKITIFEPSKLLHQILFFNNEKRKYFSMEILCNVYFYQLNCLFELSCLLSSRCVIYTSFIANSMEKKYFWDMTPFLSCQTQLSSLISRLIHIFWIKNRKRNRKEKSFGADSVQEVNVALKLHEVCLFNAWDDFKYGKWREYRNWKEITTHKYKEPTGTMFVITLIRCTECTH